MHEICSMKALRDTTKRRSSTRLAGADCFVPGQLDSLRALSSTQRPMVWDSHEEQDAQSMMSQGNVIWLDDQGQEIAAPAGTVPTSLKDSVWYPCCRMLTLPVQHACSDLSMRLYCAL